MKVLCLGNGKESQVFAWLTEHGEQVTIRSDRLAAPDIEAIAPDFIVSHNYTHILSAAVLESAHGAAINLHISLLPWNRGSYPNVWSFIDGTPAGVTIHYIDEGIDTGDIIAQRRVDFDEERETLATSHARLNAEIVDLFVAVWPAVIAGTAPRKPQIGAGSYHRDADIVTVFPLLPLGWDTPVKEVRRICWDSAQ